MKKCTKGQSCASTCISRGYKCHKQLTAAANKVIEQLRGVAKAEKPKPKAEPKILSSKEVEDIVKEGNVLGQGAFGKVYQRGDVVVKVISVANEDLVKDEVEITREMGKLGVGPKILSEIAFERKGGFMQATYAMEKVKGVTIAQLGEDSSVDPKKTEAIVTKIMEQGKKMHEAGIVHQDLHKGNIVVDPNTSKVTFIDFGSAKRSRDKWDQKGDTAYVGDITREWGVSSPAVEEWVKL